MFCAISGQIPQSPVFAPKSGLLYEERLLRKALETNNGTCPVTGIALSFDSDPEDLFTVKSTPVSIPRPPSVNSFPAILGALQNEWDSLLLEQIELRKELLETRRDLSTALYEREAASGVIARLLKENDVLKDELSSLSKPGSNLENKGNSDTVPDKKSKHAEIIESTEKLLREARTAFSKSEKTRKHSFALKEAHWKEAASLTPHKSRNPGASCLALESYNVLKGDPKTACWVVSGGVDGTVKVIDATKQEIAATLTKHSSRVNDVSLREGILTSASNDKTMIVWTGDWGNETTKPKLKFKHVFKTHSKAVNACPIHPSCKLAGSVGNDGKWVLSDLEVGEVVVKYDGQKQLQTADFHPDGKLFGVGTNDGKLLIFNLETEPGEGPAVDPFVHGSNVNAMAFSENGYLLASAGDDGCAKIWDLRKPGTCVKTLEFISGGDNRTIAATALQFDFSGSYLAVGNSNGGLNVYERLRKSEWTTVMSLQDDSEGRITGVAFDPRVQGLWTSSMDRRVKLFK